MEEVTSDSPTEPSTLTGAAGTLAGRYRVRARLGRGGSKEVYLAYDERLDRQVALAIMVGAGGGEAGRARVEREARVTGRLGDHPNVITVYDSGEHDGIPYLVLRAMTGGSLADALLRPSGERPDIAQAIAVARQVAAALAHAHAHGIVHRDVKPDNIWLGDDGSAALGDFGIAYDLAGEPVAGEAGVVGTVRYVSPEQARGDELGPASDLYSLGITLYELVTGQTPFNADMPGSILAQHIASPPVAPSQHEPTVPPPLERLILDLLAKEPAARPSSAAVVAGALAAISESAVLGRDRLVGREPVLKTLMAAWSDALSGRPGVVALSGEPGIGKTRCAQELAHRVAGDGAAVAWGLCAEHEGVAAYWPWTRALREIAPLQPGGPLEALLGERPEEPEAGASTLAEARFRLFDAVAAQLEQVSSSRPHLVVLEDLHWADRSSIELLVHVTRELRRGHLLILLTLRAAEVVSGHPLASALGELARRPAFHRLELRGLNAADVASYVELATGRPTQAPLAEALLERTGGNPFFVSEVVRLLSEDSELEEAMARGPVLPGAVRDVVSARLERLPVTTRAAIEAAAVAGQEFGIALVASAAQVSRAELLDALVPAIGQHVVTPGPDPARWRFAHAIVRDAVHEGLTAPRRAHLHARLGTLLSERRARGQPQPASEAAHHFLESARAGGDPQPALDAALEAAREARAQLAHAEAAGHHEAALEAADLADAGGHERGRLLLDLAEARRNAGDIDRARHAYADAAAIGRALGETDLLAAAAEGFAEWQLYGGVDDEAVRLLEEALAHVPQADSIHRAKLLGRLAVRLDPRREEPRRQALIDEAITICRELGDPVALAWLLVRRFGVYWRPESVQRRAADLTEAITLAVDAGDLEAALWARSMRFADRFMVGDMAGVDADLDGYARLARNLRQPMYHWWLTMGRATRVLFDGRLRDGRQLADQALAQNRKHDLRSDEEHPVQMLMLAAASGRVRGLDREPLHRFAQEYPHLPVWRAMACYADWLSEDARGAAAGLRALGGDEFAGCLHAPDPIGSLSFAAHVCAGLEDRPRAAILHGLLAPYRDRNVVIDLGWGAFGAAAHPLGLLATTLGETRLAAEHFGRAIELHRAWGCRPWLARTLIAAGGAEQRAEARALARELEIELDTEPV